MVSRIVFSENSPKGLIEKDRRFERQTVWSAELRKYVYQQISGENLRILETGCGTGAVLRCVRQEIPDRIGLLCGIDLSFRALKFASGKTAGEAAAADGAALPFPENSFDLVFCHYLLLWVKDPAAVLREMRRVLRPGGLCAALAEPDYDGMKASPEALFELAARQRAALIRRGIDPETGKKLGAFFTAAGFSTPEYSLYKKAEFSPESLKNEIGVMLSDAGIKKYTMDPKLRYDYYVPTYYAIVRK